MTTPSDRPRLHAFTLAFLDGEEERAYLTAIARRFSRRRYATTSIVFSVLWAATGAWMTHAHPTEGRVVVATFFGFALPLIFGLTIGLYLLPRDIAMRRAPVFTLVVCGALGFMPAANVALGSAMLVGLCIYLVTLHGAVGLRFVHALPLSIVHALAYLVALAAHGAPVVAVVESAVWLSAAELSASFVSYTEELQRRRVFHQSRLLAEERAKSERLLANMLPVGVVERLKVEPLPIADAVPEATVLFADLVGFTKLSSCVTPRELVAMLNELFTAFDGLVSKHGLEKIKTIGDAYMVVAGAPRPRADHAGAMAQLALEMHEAVRSIGDGSFEMRIGMHSGSLVAGVIGTSKYSYDLWGDTVNTASRMESHGAPGRIHVSEACRALLASGRWCFEERGEIEVKGKGLMHTFWLSASA